MRFQGLAAVRHWPRLPPLSPSCRNGSNSPMAEGDPIRIIPHRGVDDDSGSLEVWFADGRKSVGFYWDNLVSRRLSSNTLGAGSPAIADVWVSAFTSRLRELGWIVSAHG